MLKGYDTSHHQNNAVFNEAVANSDFMIIKATEGKTYIDGTFKDRAYQLYELDKLNGFYHFARPDNNTAKEEANHFINTISKYMNYNTILVLDWEGKALNYSFEWALEFCKIVSEKTQRPCIIYASASVVRKYAHKYKYWWTSHYNNICENGCTHDGVEEVMTQYTSTPIDIDVFHGTEKDWYTLCGYKQNKTQTILYEWKENNKHYKLICEE